MRDPSVFANRLPALLAACCGLLLVACATVRVHFPADAAQVAADRVIDEVWGGQARPAAQVVEESKLNLSSPEIQRLVDSMEARLRDLSPYYESGAVGFGADGYIMVRDNNQVPQPQRNTLRTLVANENADRATLYRELAVSSSQAQWEKPIRAVFAKRWIQRARQGWYVQDGSAWKKN